MTKSAIERLRELLVDAAKPQAFREDTLIVLSACADRLTRALVAEGEREIVARIVDPEAWESRRDRLVLAEEWRGRVGPDHSQQTCDFMSSRRAEEAESLVAPSLAKADATLEHLAGKALGDA